MAAKDFVWGNPHPEQEPNKYKWVKLPLKGKHMSKIVTRESLKRLVQEELARRAEGPDDATLYESEEENVYFHLEDATTDDGNLLDEDFEFWDDVLEEAEYQGRKVTLNKPTRGDVKKFKVYVKDPKTGNVKKVNFGDPNMRIKKSNPARRKSFRARHKCKTPGPKTKARYWSCKKW
tara:strand:- start:339 stop:869 length:531 start_codon:yes stop_codon:yes gene_type:complete